MSGKPASKSDYQNVFERAFDGHMDPGPLIKGISSYEAALVAHNAAHEFNAKKEDKEAIVAKLKEYKNE